MSSAPLLSEQLDRLISIQNSAYESAGSTTRIQLNPPASDSDIARAEALIGRQLPEEVRTLYRWHDGCAIWLVPSVGFRGLGASSQAFSIIQPLELPELSNGEVTFESGSLFPVFDMDKPSLAVIAARGSRQRESALYVLDFEMGQLTMVARSMSAYIAHLYSELEAGNFVVTVHGLKWKRDPIRFSRTMTPIG